MTPESAELRPVNRDEQMVLFCPFCGHKNLFSAFKMMREAVEICDGCGSRIDMKFQTKPMVKISGKVQGNNGQGSCESADIQVVQRLDGMWFFLNEDEAQILETLDHDSDRAVAVIVGSMVESRLQRALKVRMPQDKKAIDKVFKYPGSLSSFAAKIDVAYLNGLVSKDAYEDLKRFKDIRNDFAHELDIRNFNSESIKIAADRLKLIDEYVVDGAPDAKGNMKFMELDVGAKPAIYALHATKRKKLPRDRYLMTAQLFTVKMATADLKFWPLPFI